MVWCGYVMIMLITVWVIRGYTPSLSLFLSLQEGHASVVKVSSSKGVALVYKDETLPENLIVRIAISSN